MGQRSTMPSRSLRKVGSQGRRQTDILLPDSWGAQVAGLHEGCGDADSQVESSRSRSGYPEDGACEKWKNRGGSPGGTSRWELLVRQ